MAFTDYGSRGNLDEIMWFKSEILALFTTSCLVSSLNDTSLYSPEQSIRRLVFNQCMGIHDIMNSESTLGYEIVVDMIRTSNTQAFPERLSEANRTSPIISRSPSQCLNIINLRLFSRCGIRGVQREECVAVRQAFIRCGPFPTYIACLGMLQIKAIAPMSYRPRKVWCLMKVCTDRLSMSELPK